MNKLEKKMVEILKLGKEQFGYLGVKAEFEAEGTRTDELLRLIEVARVAGVKIGLKVGGCEAVRDLLTCRQIGVDYIIAPMIETAYALSKYIAAKNMVYSEYEQTQTRFLFNLETITGFQNLNSLIECATSNNGVDGIVFGRVDFVGSKQLSRNKIASEEIINYCVDVAKQCKKHKLDFVVGGGVSKETLHSITAISSTYLNRFETRKIIFDANNDAFAKNADLALNKAVEFELLWLQNKRNYYYSASQEDESRIKMLEDRCAQFELSN
jgi:hypothetical protein